MFRAQSAHHQEVNDANCTYAVSGIVKNLCIKLVIIQKVMLSCIQTTNNKLEKLLHLFG